ncbi:60S ribosomal protein L7-1-like [Brachypodium distachyon]|uniref:60S ribosomal protein L7-1-like n=1 Tax=Brachypodium distachyon TaxID=15368 RepID=UPI00071C88D3|nr:60S ribosomal protein L7-1-like [Brachypodium distachyon]|eukprot:XP_014751760.1 60S ribosomal protein L7-1-like [Brachypodium distachyon]
MDGFEVLDVMRRQEWPEEFIRKFRDTELDFLRMRTRLKACRLSPAESHDDAQLLFAICSSGTKELHPRIKKILARLRLTQMVTGVFLKTAEVNLKMLASVVPFVTYR